MASPNHRLDAYKNVKKSTRKSLITMSKDMALPCIGIVSAFRDCHPTHPNLLRTTA